MSKHGPPAAAHEESSGESAPLWVISFADMVTLLMSFFVLMMASTPKGQTSSDPNAELLKVLASVKVAFNYRPKPHSQDPLDLEVLKILSQSGSQGEAEHTKSGESGGGKWWKGAGIKGTSPEVSDLWNRAHAVVGEPVPFDLLSDVITPEAHKIVAEVAEVVRDHYRILILRGHVSFAEAQQQPDGGWDLAYHRAAALKEALVAQGVARNRMRLLACGPHEQVFSDPKTDDEHAANRRAEITLGAQFLPNRGAPPQPAPGSGGDRH